MLAHLPVSILVLTELDVVVVDGLVGNQSTPVQAAARHQECDYHEDG
jgi:hypothetical protein